MNRSIPNQIKRSVRQCCGFGCVICGLPIYEYDHMVPWNKVKRHNSENITLLCDMHHKEKTNGLLSLKDVQEANTRPYNLRGNRSKPYLLHYSGASCNASIGSNIHTWPTLEDGDFVVPLSIDDTPIILFRREENHLLLTLQLFNRSNELILQIIDNELVYSTNIWDIELVGKTLTLRNQQNSIFAKIQFAIPNTIKITQGHIWRNGAEIDISLHSLMIGKEIWMSGILSDKKVGFALGNPPSSIAGGTLVFMTPRVAITPQVTETRVRKFNNYLEKI